MSHQFCFIGHSISGDNADLMLESFEWEHVRKVLKLKLGDIVQVTDGQGLMATGPITALSNSGVQVKATAWEKALPPKTRKAIVFGALKPGGVDEVLPALTEWGLDDIHIFQQQDTAKYRTADRARDRWDRILISALKQSKRSWLPRLFLYDSLGSALEQVKTFDLKIMLEAHAAHAMHEHVVGSQNIDAVKSIACVIGGEKGFSESEFQQAKSLGFIPTSMGSYILRATTAVAGAAAFISVISKAYEKNSPS